VQIAGDIVVMQTPENSWQELFAPAGDGSLVSLYAVSRGGKPFLFLPSDNRAAATALEIYPAQTVKARIAKTALGMMLRVGLRLGLRKTSLTISNTDPFAAFLRAAARVEPGEPFSFAVLTGNPSAPGRRHVFLLFNASAQPVAVVKAGTTSRARELIAHETSLLSAFASAQSGLPKLRGACELENLSAFAMDFIEGTSPGDDVNGELEKIFSSWMDSAKQIELGDTAAWQRLVQAHGATTMPEAVRGLETLRVFPVLMHGDFAPWNVKVSDGQWTVLDWERGERVGIPAWDWLHFVVQPAVLVQREATETTMSRLEKLFTTAEFQRYAERCGILGAEWELTFAYVDYCINVTRQTEGLKSLEALRDAILARWTTA
jgi:hypothetical protein